MPTSSLRVLGIIFAVLTVCVLPGHAVGDPDAENAPAIQAAPAALPDIDAMAARMKAHQDIYAKIRDGGLATYAAESPKTAAADVPMKNLIRIQAYLWVWGDRYGEGLYHQAYLDALDATKIGIVDWLENAGLNEESLQGHHSSDEGDAMRIGFALSHLADTTYPAAFKMQACAMLIGNQVAYKVQAHGDPTGNSFKFVPVSVKRWGQAYRQMIKDKWPHDLLDDAGANLLCQTQDDEATLDLAIAEIDEDFNETDPGNPVKIALDGEYFTDAAWCARGSGWASSVNEDGWKVFGDRLVKADEILEAGYAKYPSEGEIARSMLAVELGQGQGRDRMELWFQRAIKANPDDYCAYQSKEWYLQPRWYGSVDDVVSFGQECVKTGNWQARLPLVFTKGIADASDQDASLYSREDIWSTVEKVYREYLSRYPKSVVYRTAFAQHAADSGHLDIAREQFKILGPDWDRGTLSTDQYETIMDKLGLDTK